MIPAYLLRLACLSMSAFFLVHLAAGLIVSAMAPWAARRAERMPSGSAVRWLLALRLAPPALAFFVVAALCIPSYLWLEPEAAGEEIGPICLISAALGLAVWIASLTRGTRALARSLRYIERCRRIGFLTRLAGDPSPVWVMEGAAGSLLLAGVLRPRLFISQKVMSVLSADQLTAAVRHEHAHRVSHDNLKRLLILLSPGLLPFFRGFELLEARWARFTEWAADDRAVDGDARRSVSLAGALVRVARLTSAPHLSPVITSLIDEGRDLEARVDRLLRATPPAEPPRRMPVMAAGTALLLTGLLASVMLRPATFYGVHRLLEQLIH